MYVRSFACCLPFFSVLLLLLVLLFWMTGVHVSVYISCACPYRANFKTKKKEKKWDVKPSASIPNEVECHFSERFVRIFLLNFKLGLSAAAVGVVAVYRYFSSFHKHFNNAIVIIGIHQPNREAPPYYTTPQSTKRTYTQ